jgi:TPP-dependent pyruvate/acetoin dehydrogenase alpha subunit
VRDEIDAAVEAAKAADPPPASELTRDIYVGSFPPPRMCNV